MMSHAINARLFLAGYLGLLSQVPGWSAALDHFLMAPVASPQTSGVPFEVTVSAVGLDGNPLIEFAGEAFLSARAGIDPRRLVISEIDLGYQVVELINPYTLAVDISGWRLDIFGAFGWPEPTAAFVFPAGTVMPPYDVIQVTAFGPAPGNYPVFHAAKPFSWSISQMQSPVGVALRDGDGKLVDLVSLGTFVAAETTLPIAPKPWVGDPLLLDFSWFRSFQRIGNCDHDNRWDWTRAPASLGQRNSELRLPFLRDEVLIGVEPGSVEFQDGLWRGTVSILAPGTSLSLRMDDGDGRTGESNPFQVSPGPSLNLSGPAESFEASAGLAGLGSVAVIQAPVVDLEVVLSSSMASEIRVPSSIVIQAGTTSTTFAVTNLDDAILDGTRPAVITAAAPGYLEASMVILNHDDEVAVLTLAVPDTVSESDGVLLSRGTVTLDVPSPVAVSVSLACDQPALIGVPAAILIPPGAYGAKFDLVVKDDDRFGGAQEAEITASVVGWTGATQTITVLDSETRDLSLAIEPGLMEGMGTWLNGATVSISGTLSTNLLVSLDCDQPERLGLPATVTIPAGFKSVPVTVNVPENAIAEGTITVLISASAPGFSSAQTSALIRDNDVHHFVFGPLPPAQFSGQPFAVTIYALAIDETEVSSYSGTVSLEAIGNQGTVLTLPSELGPFVNGTWTGTIMVPTENHQTRLVAHGPTGQTGASEPFDVVSARLLDLPVSDLVYHSGTGKILAGVSAGSAHFPQSIVEIDPVSGQVGNPIALEDEPGPLALSDDGKYLYVALMSTGGVARVDLDTRSVDLRFPLGADETHGFGPFFVEDMATVPGNPRSLVVSLRVAFNAYGYGVAVFDDGVPRPAGVGPADFANEYRIAFYDSATSFCSTFPTGLRRLALTPDGVVLVQEFRGDQFGGDLEFAAGFLFSTRGDVYAARDLRRIGSLGSGGLVRPEVTMNRVYVLDQDRLGIFDLFALQELGSLRIPGDNGVFGSLISCGAHGIAFRTSQGKVLLLRTVLDPAMDAADLAVTQSTDSTVARVGDVFAYSITLTNRGPDTATNCVLADVLPLDASFVSATVSQGEYSFTNGVLSCAMGSIPSGGRAQITLVISPNLPGELINTTYVLGGTLAPENDVWRQTNVVTFGGIPPAVTRLSAALWDLGYDPAFHRLHLGVYRWNDGPENSLRPLDLNTGLIGLPAALEAAPRNLVIAPDGLHAYVGVQLKGLDTSITSATDVQYIDLQTGAIKQQFEVVDHFGQQHSVRDMKIMPGRDFALVMSRAGPQNDVAIYEEGIQTLRSPTDLHCHFVEFADSSEVLFGITYGPWATLYRMEVSDTGLDLTHAVGGLGTNPEVHVKYADGRLFLDSGEVLDAASLTQLATLPVSGLVQTDPDAQRVYYLTPREGGWVLAAFDTISASAVWSFSVPGVLGVPVALISCGSDLLAFRTTADELFILNTALMPGEPVTDVALSLRMLSPSAGLGLPLTLEGIVTNRGPVSANNVSLTISLPPGLDFQSASVTQGSWHAADQAVQCEFGTLAEGGMATVTLELIPTIGGTLRIGGSVELSEQDRDSANNSAAVTVYSPSPIGDGVRLIEIASADLAYDPVRGSLYASVPSSAGPEGNSILELDPETGALGSPIPAGSEPGKLVVSNDGEFLYVALDGESAVRRFRVDSLTSDLTFSIGAGLRVADMEVLPGDSSGIAVSRSHTHGGSPQHEGLAIYDEGVVRPQASSVPVFANVIAFSESPTTLFAFDNETSAFTLYTFLVGPDGVSPLTAEPDLCFGYGVDIEYAAGRLYATSGAVIDPLAGVVVGRCAGPGLGDSWGASDGTLVEPDPDHGVVYFLVLDGGTWKLKSYDVNTFVAVGSLDVPGVWGTPSSLVRAGDQLLAFRTSANQLFLCERSRIRAADLVLSQSASPLSSPEGGNLTYTIAVSNQGPAAAANVVVQDVLPRELELGMAEASTGEVEINGNTISWILGELADGESASLTLRVLGNQAGLAVNQASVQTTDFDPVPENNSSVLLTSITRGATQQSVESYSLPASQIIYDPTRGQILAGLSAAAHGVVSFDLESRTFGELIPLGAAPGTLALAESGEYLYAGVNTGGVARIDLAVRGVDLRFEVGTDWQGWSLLAEDMQVVPGQPETVAIAQGYSGVGLYRDGILLPGFVPQREFGGVYPIGFGSATRLYSALPFTLRTISVDASGLVLEGEYDGLVPEYETRFKVDHDLLFFLTGRVVNPATLEIAGEFPVGGLVAPDVAQDRVYFLSQVDDPFEGSLLTLRGCQLSTLSELWSLRFPPGSGAVLSFLKLDSEGFAFLTDAGRLFVVRSDFLAIPSADLAVSLLPDRDPVNLHGSLSYTCIISNAGPWTSSGATLRSTVPAGSTLVSATASQGECALVDGEVVCDLGSLPGATSALVNLVFSPSVLGATDCSAWVSGNEVDPVAANNASGASISVVPQPEISIIEKSLREGQMRSANMAVTVQLSAPSSETVSVDFSTSDGTAVAGTDYEAGSGSVTFGPGTTQRAILVRIYGDTVPEPDETFFVSLANPENATLLMSQAVATILNDDYHTITLVGPSLPEGSSGVTEAIFQLRLSAPSSETVAVDFNTADGSALANTDYLPKTGTLLFPPGITTKTVSVGVIGNGIAEPDKFFYLVLRNPSGAFLGANETMAVIVNDDIETPLVITLVALDEQVLHLRFPATAGRQYLFERSLDLYPGAWTILETWTAPTDGLIEVVDPEAAALPQAYYRIRRME